MAAIILDGKSVSQAILIKLKNELLDLNPKPGLAVILVGDDPGSQIYVRNKEKACEQIGYASTKILLPESVSSAELFTVIDRLNTDPKIHGILCQFPLPGNLHLIENQVINRITGTKDVDGFHPLSNLKPCTPSGIIELLNHYELSVSGKQAVVLGRSPLTGMAIARMLLDHDATVTIAHSKTPNISQVITTADILVSAIGKPGFVPGDWLKPGSIVIDVGINRTDHGIVGDIDFKSAKEKAAYITPVPGGIGPMTIAMLMANVLMAYHLDAKEHS